MSRGEVQHPDPAAVQHGRDYERFGVVEEPAQAQEADGDGRSTLIHIDGGKIIVASDDKGVLPPRSAGNHHARRNDHGSAVVGHDFAAKFSGAGAGE